MRRPLSDAWILGGGCIVLMCATAAAWAAQAPAACCMPDGTCVDLLYSDCVAQGGFPQDPSSSCANGVPCHPLKWAQPPTLTPFSPLPGCFWGWDEPSVYEPPVQYPILADDFACTSQRPITDVHWWGSYLNWVELEPPPAGIGPLAFHIGIWTDVPANDPTNPVSFSHPGVLLWQWIAPRELLSEHAVACDFHPDFMQMPETCFRYDFIIPNPEWFYQEPGHNVYWLSISAIYQPSPTLPVVWGWKTRQPVWNDGAVRMYGPPLPQPGGVFDPMLGEPLMGVGEPWDLAFVLTTEPRPPLEPKWTQWPAATNGFDAASDVWIHDPGPGTKWEQLPDVNAGHWHAHDYFDGIVVRQIIVADDWKCEGGVVSDFHWWGEYEIVGSDLWGFHLSIHPNDPFACLPIDPSIWEANVPMSQITVTTDGQLPDGSPLYRYDYNLPTPFAQEPGQTYWFDVSAISNNATAPCVWTWQEAAPDPLALCPPAYRDAPVTLQWQTLGPSNMAFRVTSVDIPQPVVNKVVADDFVSDGRPIERVRWWGSYLDPLFEPPTINPQYEIDGWFISFHHESAVAPTCPPGIPDDLPPTVIGLYFAPANAVTVLGLDTTDCLGHGLYEYFVDLSQCCLICARPDPRTGFAPALPDAFAEEAGLRYWLDIQAVVGIGWTPNASDPPCLPFSTLHRPHFVTGTDAHFWGWHTSLADTMLSALDTACTGQLVWPDAWVAGDCPDYRGWVKQPWLCPFVPGPPVHMAFELLTSLPYGPQACCEASGRCTMTDPLACVFVRHGQPQGPGSVCVPNACPLCPGDMNCDGRVNFADIDKFVEALSGQAAWEANPTNKGCPWLNADCNFDGTVSFKDIDPFVARLGALCGP